MAHGCHEPPADGVTVCDEWSCGAGTFILMLWDESFQIAHVPFVRERRRRALNCGKVGRGGRSCQRQRDLLLPSQIGTRRGRPCLATGVFPCLGTIGVEHSQGRETSPGKLVFLKFPDLNSGDPLDRTFRGRQGRPGGRGGARPCQAALPLPNRSSCGMCFAASSIVMCHLCLP